MHLLLKVLAFVDNIYLLNDALCICILFIETNQYNDIDIIIDLIAWMTRFCTVYMTLLIAFMRYIAVCKPFRAAKIYTKKNAWIAMIAGLTLNFIIHIPMFCTFGQHNIDDK